MKRFNSSLAVLVGLIVLEAALYLVAVRVSEPYSASTRVAYVLDRFEDNGWAVLEREEGITFDFPEVSLPKNTQQGDVLVFIKLKDGTLLVHRDEAETAQRRQAAELLKKRIPLAPEEDLEL